MKLAVEIEVRQTGNGFALVNNGLTQISSNSGGAAGGLGGVDSALSSIGSRIGAVAVITGVGAAMTAALTTGVQFNALLESSLVGISSIIAQTGELTDAQGKRLKGIEEYNAAEAIGLEMQKDLKTAALETAAGYDQLLTGLQAVLVTHRNAFDSKQVIEFTKSLSQAAAAIDPMLLKEGQFAQEIRGVLEGDMSRASRLSRVIFSDFKGNADELKKKLEELRKEGKLFDFLQERLAAFAIGGEKSLNTLNTASSNFRDAFMQAMGESTTGLTKDLTDALNGVVKGFTYVDAAGQRAFRPELVESIREIADALGWVVEKIGKLIAIMPEWQSEMEASSDRWHRKIVPILAAMETVPGFMGGLNDLTQGYFTRRLAELEGQKAAANNDRQTSIAFMDQLSPTTGWGTEGLSGFRDLAAAGDELRKLATEDTPVYLAALRKINEFTKDGTLTYMEFRKAINLARKELSGGKKLGPPGLEPPDPDAARKAAEAAAKRLEEVRKSTVALHTFIGAQEQSTAASRQQIEVVNGEVEILRIKHDLDAAISDSTMDRLGALRLQATLQDRLNAAEKDRAGLEAIQRETAEEYRRLEALKKIDEMQAKLDREQSEFINTKGVKGINADEARVQQALINRSIDTENEQHGAVVKLNAARSQQDLTAIALAGERQRRENAVEQWEQSNRHLLKLYDDFNETIVNGAHDTVMAVFRGGDLQDAFDGLLDGFRNAWASLIADMAKEWLDGLRKRAVGTPDMTDEHGRVWKGMEPDRGAQTAYAGIQGAAALYGLYQQGQQGMTPGQGAASGAMAGAAIGMQLGVGTGQPWLIAAGIVLGAVFGAMMGKEEAGLQITSVNGKLSVTGGGSTSNADLEDALRGINMLIASTRMQMLDLLDAFPTELMQTLLGEMSATTEGDLFGNFDIGQQRWKNWLAKQFGSLGKAMRGMLSPDDFKRWVEIDLPNMMFDAYAPIIEGGLKELGVTDAKIRELLEKAPGFDAKAALEKLRDYVTVLVGFIDSDEFNRLSQADLMDRAVATIGETPIAAIRRIGDEMAALAVGYEDLTTEEQVRRGQQILALETDRQQMVLQYLYRIQQAQEAAFKAIDAQVAEIDFQDMGPFAQLTALRDRIAEIATNITTAATPEELSALGSEYQQLVGRVYELSVRLPEEINALIDGFKALDEIMAPARSPFERLGDLQTKIADAYTRMSNATNPSDQVTAARELLGLTQERYALERQMLDEINSVLTGMNSMLDETIRNFGLEASITDAEARGATPEEIANIRIGDLMERQRELRNRLLTADSASEITEIVAEMNRNANSLFDLMGKTPEAAAQLTAMLEDVRNIAREKLLALAAAIGAADQANRDHVTAAVTMLTAALLLIPPAAEAAKAALEALRVLLATRFTELTDEVIEANRNLLEMIGDILEALREGIDGIINDPNRPGGGTGVQDPTDPVTPTPHSTTYTPPDAAVTNPTIVIVNDVGQPAVFVTLSGSAEALIDSVMARAEMRAQQVATRAVAIQSAGRRGL